MDNMGMTNGEIGKKGRSEKSSQFISIEKKISKRFAQTIMICCILLGAIASVLSYISSINAISNTMDSTSDIAADYVKAALKEYTAVAYETGSIARLADATKSVQEKQSILNQRIKDHNFEGGYLLDSKGKDVISGADLSDQDYFKAAMQGKHMFPHLHIIMILSQYFMRCLLLYGRTVFREQHL